MIFFYFLYRQSLSSVNKDRLFFTSQSVHPLFSCFITLARTSSMVLKGCGESLKKR
jgi:hypothetical protein